MPQITSITSEALQAAIRRLLPSQVGFGEDLQAINVVTPIIDLTPTAEGSSVPVSMQQALSFGSQTAFDVVNTTSTLVNTSGFYRIYGGISLKEDTGSSLTASLALSDGFASKIIYKMPAPAGGTQIDTGLTHVLLDFVVYLDSGESLTATSSSTFVTIAGSTRQIADKDGNLVNPSGFTPQ